MRHRGASSESLVGLLMVGGAATCGIGILLTLIVLMSGVLTATATRNPSSGAVSNIGLAALTPVFLGLAGLGALIFVGGLGYGIFLNSTGPRGERRTLRGVRVIARIGFSRSGNLVPDYELEVDETARTYVKLDLGGGVMDEFECVREVYYAAGEGMVGDAEVQGKWLGAFHPIIGQRSE